MQDNDKKRVISEVLVDAAHIISGSPQLNILPKYHQGVTNASMFIYARAQCDRVAVFKRYHSLEIHQKLRRLLLSNDSQRVFDRLEQHRVELLAGKEMIGVGINLIHLWQHEILGSISFEEGLGAMLSSNKIVYDNYINFLIYALSGYTLSDRLLQHCCSSEFLMDCKNELSNIQDIYIDSRSKLTSILALLNNLSCSIDSQTRFAEFCIDFLTTAHHSPDEKKIQADNYDNEQEKSHDKYSHSHGDENTEAYVHSDISYDQLPEGANEKAYLHSSNPVYVDSESYSGKYSTEATYDAISITNEDACDVHSNTTSLRCHTQAISETQDDYRIFTRQFDKVVHADKLTDVDSLNCMWQELEDKVQPFKHIIAKLSHKLTREITTITKKSLYIDDYSGALATEFLSRIIASPSALPVYRQVADLHAMDTVVTILIDNSGSMRGKPISIAAMCASIFARALERCKVKVEILGFTTREWKGGLSAQLWKEQGSPERPGRLNDILHIIYKDANMSWRHSYRNIGLMLQKGLLKENIDGEALEWAASRLSRRHEAKKILMVISDGAPVDDATLSMNDKFYLDRHLYKVIRLISKPTSSINLFAIGIGHNVTLCYPHSVMIRTPEELAEVMINKLCSYIRAGFHRQKKPQ